MQRENWKTAARKKDLWEANEDNYVQKRSPVMHDDDGAARCASRVLVFETALADTQVGRSNGARAPTAHLARLDREIP